MSKRTKAWLLWWGFVILPLVAVAYCPWLHAKDAGIGTPAKYEAIYDNAGLYYYLLNVTSQMVPGLILILIIASRIFRDWLDEKYPKPKQLK